MVFLKDCFQKVKFEKNQQMTKKHEKLPSMQCVKFKQDDHTVEKWTPEDAK